MASRNATGIPPARLDVAPRHPSHNTLPIRVATFSGRNERMVIVDDDEQIVSGTIMPALVTVTAVHKKIE